MARGRKAGLARRLAVVAASVGLLAACTKTLDSGKLESTLKTDIAKKAGTAVKSVSCPDNVKAEKGNTFQCTLVAGDGTTHHVKITQTDDSGHVTYQVTD